MIILFENIFLIYFVLSLYLISRSLSLYFFKDEKNENYTLIFLLLIIVITYIIFLLITLNQYNNSLIYIVSTICLLFPLILINKIKQINLNRFIKNKILLLFLPYFIISLLPASDPDSLDYHLGVAKFWIENEKNLPLDNWLHFRLASYGETLNIFSILLFGGKMLSFLKVFLLYLVTKTIYYNYKKVNNFNIFIYSLVGSPILIYFISNQKPQFIGFIILIFCILLLNLKKNEFYLSFLLAYVSSLKFSFIPVILVLFFFILIFEKINKQKFIFSILFFVLLFWGPILTKNYLFYSNPMSPFFENLLSNAPNDTVVNFSNMLRNFTEFGYSPFKQFLNILVPLNFGAISTSFGLSIFFLIFFKFNKNYSIKFLILSFFIIAVYFLIGQYSTRYLYFSYFLIILSFIFHDIKFKKILYSGLILQTVFVYIFLFFISFQNLTSLVNEKKNHEYLSKKAYQYNEAQWIKEIIKKENYVSDMRSKYFLENNHFSIEFAFYTPKKHLNSELLKFIKKNKINKISLIVDQNHVYKMFKNCKKNLVVKSFKIARRNFLAKEKIIQREIFEYDFENRDCQINS